MRTGATKNLKLCAKVLLVVLLSLMIFDCVGSATAEAARVRVKTKLNLRVAPSHNAPIATQLYNGDYVEIMGEVHNEGRYWCNVRIYRRYNGAPATIEGWAASQYLSYY